MPRLTRIAALVLLPALLSFAFIACGGDDDDGGAAISRDNGSNSGGSSGSNSSSGSNASSSSDDKKDDSGDIKPSGNTGSDEAYVSDICKGFSEYMDGIASALSGVDITDPDYEKKLNEKLTNPIKAVAKVFADADPPSDLKDWHADVVAAFNQMVKSLEAGDYDALEDDSLEFPDMPAGAEERLSKIAENDADCKALSEDGLGVFDTAGGS